MPPWTRQVGLEEKLLSGFGLFQASGPRHDLACFGMERASATPRQADLMILVGRVSRR
jgi:NADH:ubiquinone oxidoreductase subunit B-like Fe-S oxidoreductase